MVEITEKPNQNSTPERKEKILIVDDDPNAALSLELLLSRQGYDIKSVHTGKAALALAEATPFNIVLLDIKLPDITGIKLLTPLKNTHPRTAVIMMTAYASMESAVTAVNEGATAYIVKPFDVESVLATINNVIQDQKFVTENWRLYERIQQELVELKRTQMHLHATSATTERLNDSLRVINTIMRHDLRNKLFNIRGCIELSQASIEKAPSYLDAAASAADQSMRLIDRMRDLERLVIQDAPLKSEDVRATIKRIMEDHHPLPVPTTVTGDGVVAVDEAFTSIIDNLLTNAWSHSETGKIDVEIKEIDQDWCEIRIIDYGKGIPEEHKSKLFQEGQKFGETAQHGIGLWLVKRAVERYGGSVAVEDTKPHGTTFKLRLKRQPETQPREEELISTPEGEVTSRINASKKPQDDRTQDRPHAKPAIGKHFVIMIDDDHECLELSKLCLNRRETEFEIVTFSDPVEALQEIRRTHFDAIVCDFQMPVINGLQLLKTIRSEGVHIPFIMLTGQGGEDILIEAINRGADYYLQKGRDVRTVYNKLENALLTTIHRRREMSKVSSTAD